MGNHVKYIVGYPSHIFKKPRLQLLSLYSLFIHIMICRMHILIDATHGIYYADFKRMIHKQYLAGEAPAPES